MGGVDQLRSGCSCSSREVCSRPFADKPPRERELMRVKHASALVERHFALCRQHDATVLDGAPQRAAAVLAESRGGPLLGEPSSPRAQQYFGEASEPRLPGVRNGCSSALTNMPKLLPTSTCALLVAKAAWRRPRALSGRGAPRHARAAGAVRRARPCLLGGRPPPPRSRRDRCRTGATAPCPGCGERG
jgi:hypothetical protein